MRPEWKELYRAAKSLAFESWGHSANKDPGSVCVVSHGKTCPYCRLLRAIQDVTQIHGLGEDE